MDPKEIAKFITEDPDIYLEDIKVVDLEPSDKIKKSRRKRRRNKMKRRHKREREALKNKPKKPKVDPQTGQPEPGKQVLYSDIYGDESPQDIAEATEKEKQELLKNQQKVLSNLIRSSGIRAKEAENSGWESGKYQYFDDYQNQVAAFKHLYSDAFRLKNHLKNTGQAKDCLFVKEFTILRAAIEQAEQSLDGRNTSTIISFPSSGWWGRNWNKGAKKEYLITFAGEVLAQYFGRLELEREKHAKGCVKDSCSDTNHAPFIVELLCGDTPDSISLKRIFDHFNYERTNLLRSKPSKAKPKKSSTKEKKFAKSNPLHLALSMAQKDLIKRFGRRYPASGIPYIPTTFAYSDINNFATEWLRQVNANFGNEIDLEEWWGYFVDKAWGES